MHQRFVSLPCIVYAYSVNWESKAIDLAARTTLQSTLGISAVDRYKPELTVVVCWLLR